jgi:hypothetical protein
MQAIKLYWIDKILKTKRENNDKLKYIYKLAQYKYNMVDQTKVFSPSLR